MNYYAKLLFENCNNQENLKAIEAISDKAITYTAQHSDYALNKIWVNDDGFITLDFVAGQDVELAVAGPELQEIFNDKFHSLIQEETELA